MTHFRQSDDNSLDPAPDLHFDGDRMISFSLDFWQPYLIAAVVGLLIGIERQRSHPEEKTLGVRTFFLISLLGAIAGGVPHKGIAVIITAFALGLILISYFTHARSGDKNTGRGLTTEMAAGIIFCLGYTAHASPAISAVIGPLVGIVLFSKKSIHRFTHNLKSNELQAALLLLLGAMAMINWVPDATIDPWGIFNPRKFGYLSLILAILEFLSYILSKLIGPRAGSLALGILGGLVSSTAVLVSSVKAAHRHPDRWRFFLISTLSAQLASLIEAGFIIGLVSPKLFILLAPVMTAGLLIGSLIVVVLHRSGPEKYAAHELKSPLDWPGVFRLSILLGLILAATSAATILLGDRGILSISFLTGLFELHGVSLANATLFKQGHLTESMATNSILIALFASFISKTSLAWTVHRGTYTRALTLSFLLISVTMLIAHSLSSV